VIPPTRSGATFAQDLYLLWPDEVDGLTTPGPPDPALARYVAERGFTVVGEGRLPLSAQSLYQRDERPPEPIAGGAPMSPSCAKAGPSASPRRSPTCASRGHRCSRTARSSSISAWVCRGW